MLFLSSESARFISGTSTISPCKISIATFFYPLCCRVIFTLRSIHVRLTEHLSGQLCSAGCVLINKSTWLQTCTCVITPPPKHALCLVCSHDVLIMLHNVTASCVHHAETNGLAYASIMCVTTSPRHALAPSLPCRAIMR